MGVIRAAVRSTGFPNKEQPQHLSTSNYWWGKKRVQNVKQVRIKEIVCSYLVPFTIPGNFAVKSDTNVIDPDPQQL